MFGPKTYLFGGLAVLALIVGAVIWHAGQVQTVKDDAQALGVSKERAAWQSQVATQQATVAELRAKLNTLNQTHADKIKAINADHQAALTDANIALAQLERENAELKGEINATPKLQTVCAAERLPADRLRQHRSADARLSARRADRASLPSGGSADTDNRTGNTAGNAALVGQLTLTLADTERRAVQCAIALDATEARYLALGEDYRARHEAEVERHKARQAQRAAALAVAVPEE
jgi:hypothetical protein